MDNETEHQSQCKPSGRRVETKQSQSLEPSDLEELVEVFRILQMWKQRSQSSEGLSVRQDKFEPEN